MKIKYYILCLLAFAVMGHMEGGVFYYYGYENKKIFLNQVKDQVFVKFAPTTTKEQFRSVVNDNTSLRSKVSNSEKYFVEGYSSNTVVLEGQEISLDILNSLKTREEIVSATRLLEYQGSLSGITDEFIVKLKPETSYAQLQELAAKNDCRIGEEDEFVKNQYMLHVSKTSELDAMQTANLFYETELFEFAEPNLTDFNAENSLDQFFPYQWGLKNTGQYGGTAGLDIKVEQAWTITKGSPDIRIAVIDAGVDLTHSDLQSNLLAGYDATGYGTGGAPYSSVDNHGTAVAGIIGALQNNLVGGSYEGISGVAPNCKIVPVKASINNSFQRSHSSAAINWVANADKAEVINCSFGSQNAPTTNLTSAVVNAIAKGCVVVAAAGNDNLSTVSYPANSHPDVIAVGAMSFCGERKRSSHLSNQVNPGVSTDPQGVSCDGETWWGSNYGTALDIVAPGVKIYTTDIQGAAGYNTTNGTAGNYFSNFNGTSAATPHVAGIAALVLSVNPNLTSQQVRNIIESTAQKVRTDLYTYSGSSSHPNGTWNSEVGHGLVNAYAAVQAACPTLVNFTNQIITTNTTVTSCGDINVENVQVKNGAKLTLDANGYVNIIRDFDVELGSEFEIVIP